MDKKPIKVELCHDHFRRLLENEPCDQCPSLAENEQMVLAMAKLLEKSGTTRANAAVLTELHSIRRAQNVIREDVEKVIKKVDGNGSNGIGHRLTVIETMLSESRKSTPNTIALVSVVISALMSLIAILVAVASLNQTL